MKIDHLNQCSPAHPGLYQIFIKDEVNEGEDLELDELNNSGSSQKQRQQLQGALGETPATSHQLLMPNKANASPTSMPPTPPEDGQKSEKNGDPTQEGLSEPAQVVALRNGKTQTSLKTMSRRKISQQKEKKATQMLAIVLGKPVHLLLLHGFVYCTESSHLCLVHMCVDILKITSTSNSICRLSGCQAHTQARGDHISPNRKERLTNQETDKKDEMAHY